METLDKFLKPDPKERPEDLRILDELCKYIPKKDARRVLNLIKLSKKYNISHLLAHVSEEGDYLITLYVGINSIRLEIRERIPINDKPVKEWMQEMKKRTVELTIPL